MNLSTKRKQTHRHKEQTCGYQGGGMDLEFGVNKCKLLRIERSYYIIQRSIFNIL